MQFTTATYNVSIRYSIGTVPVLITVECRRRNDPQDVTWIEQLITKKDSIGAARTIAVSLRGFSKEAQDLAQRGGIELRRLENVGRSDIQSWLTPSSILHVFRQSKLIGDVRVSYEEDPSDPGDITLTAEDLAEKHKHGLNAKVFINLHDKTRMSLNDIWLRAQAQTDFYKDVPPPGEGPRRDYEIALNIPKGSLAMNTTAGPRNVVQIFLRMELWHE